jgi:HK97 family phage major capsid protein
MELEQLRQAALAAFERMESALEALTSAPEDADLEPLQREFDDAEAAHNQARERYKQTQRLEAARENLPAACEVEPVREPADSPRARVVREPLTYERWNGERSYFGDLARAHLLHDQGAWDRLNRHRQEMDVEVGDVQRRDLSSTEGQGGDFIPPIWIMDEFVSLARAGRPFANAVRRLPLPPKTDSINVPKVATGTATAAQSDLGAVQETDATTGSIETRVITVAGQQDVARQAVDRSVPGLDAILLGDLAADYATKVDVQCLTGSGSAPNARGIDNVASTISVTYTDATPTVPELYPKGADAVQQVHTQRFLSPQAWVMHPRRWGWFLAALDSQNRPLITPYVPVNAAGLLERVGAENVVGQWHGLPVIVDASIPTNKGAGTNEDIIYGVRLEDLYLWEEGEPNRATYFEVLSANLAVRFQVWGYLAFCGERYPKSISKISGTGLVTPTF